MLQNRLFFALASRSGFGAAIFEAFARSSIVFCNSASADNDFPFKIPFKKCFKIVFFSLWRRDPVLELQFATPLRGVLLCFATQLLQIAL